MLFTSLHAHETAPCVEDGGVEKARHKAVQDEHNVAPYRCELFREILTCPMEYKGTIQFGCMAIGFGGVFEVV